MQGFFISCDFFRGYTGATPAQNDLFSGNKKPPIGGGINYASRYFVAYPALP